MTHLQTAPRRAGGVSPLITSRRPSTIRGLTPPLARANCALRLLAAGGGIGAGHHGGRHDGLCGSGRSGRAERQRGPRTDARPGIVREHPGLDHVRPAGRQQRVGRAVGGQPSGPSRHCFPAGRSRSPAGRGRLALHHHHGGQRRARIAESHRPRRGKYGLADSRGVHRRAAGCSIRPTFSHSARRARRLRRGRHDANAECGMRNAELVWPNCQATETPRTPHSAFRIPNSEFVPPLRLHPAGSPAGHQHHRSDVEPGGHGALRAAANHRRHASRRRTGPTGAGALAAHRRRPARRDQIRAHRGLSAGRHGCRRRGGAMGTGGTPAGGTGDMGMGSTGPGGDAGGASGAPGASGTGGASQGGSSSTGGGTTGASQASSTNGSDSGGSTASSSSQSSSFSPDAIPGVRGYADSLKIDISRLPRRDQLLAAEQGAAGGRASDVKTVTYFVDDPGTTLDGSVGLKRYEISRAESLMSIEDGSEDRRRSRKLQTAGRRSGAQSVSNTPTAANGTKTGPPRSLRTKPRRPSCRGPYTSSCISSRRASTRNSRARLGLG